MTDLDWDDIRYMLELSRAGSLSAAARALGVEHTTVSRRITKLERDLQTKLFDRLARGWSPTSEGRHLAARAARLESEILALSRVARQGSALAGRVRISVPPFLLSEIVVPLVPAFMAAYPDIQLELFGETRPADLTRSEADIALRMTTIDSAELVARSACHIKYGLFGTEAWCGIAPDHRRYIGFPTGSTIWQAEQIDQCTGGDKYAFRTNFFGAMLNAATRGIGIAMMPDFVAAAHPGLIRFEGLEGPCVASVFLVMQRDVRHAPRIRATADFLVEALASRIL